MRSRDFSLRNVGRDMTHSNACHFIPLGPYCNSSVIVVSTSLLQILKKNLTTPCMSDSGAVHLTRINDARQRKYSENNLGR